MVVAVYEQKKKHISNLPDTPCSWHPTCHASGLVLAAAEIASFP